ncbi:OpgC family protein [Sedimentitalea arenosa]|uniref:OpgC domain-containing protein n=1 Tax=Sedimentitalea arenosa TaxID=2798803 RepID=A0A8J7JG20_9RHOB|nr:OpgC domain-containing protein [Arenibacterium arenosum]MBJ6371059.1 OpgC domain-containing protein [Arenibacterium arenosum]
MATVSPSADFVSLPVKPAAAASTTRDPRLDFYRGIAMFIILVAHIPDNAWAGWIPARFGWSDATEIFVFCSGMASAIAFGGAFLRKGWAMGTARVAFRVWQVYWAHIALFFFVAMVMAALDTYGTFERNYVESLNLGHFFDDPMTQIVGLFTLTYVPNYFDILPMYLVVLALMPLFMALAGFRLAAVAGASIALWIGANIGLLWLPAEPWSDREWFFNPFGWQLLFFTGFAFMRGWLPAPPVSPLLITAAIAFLVLSAPFGSWKVVTWITAVSPDLGDALKGVWTWVGAQERATGLSLRDKTDFGVLRYVHFLSLAYLAWVVAGDGGCRLRAEGSGGAATLWRGVLAVVTKVGQQSLAVFVFSMAVARVLGFVLDMTGRSPATFLLVNLGGFAMIIAVAYLAGWFKSQPWRSKRA